MWFRTVHTFRQTNSKSIFKRCREVQPLPRVSNSFLNSTNNLEHSVQEYEAPHEVFKSCDQQILKQTLPSCFAKLNQESWIVWTTSAIAINTVVWNIINRERKTRRTQGIEECVQARKQMSSYMDRQVCVERQVIEGFISFRCQSSEHDAYIYQVTHCQEWQSWLRLLLA